MPRTILTGPITVYVDPINGSDTSGDGSSAHPWQHVQFAHDWLVAEIDFANQSAVIEVLGSAVFNEQVTITTHPVGQHVFTIQANSANCPWLADSTAGPLISVTDYGCAIIQGFEFGATVNGAVLVNVWQNAICDLGAILWGSCVDGVMVETGDGGKVNFTGPHTIDGIATYFAMADGGVIDMTNVSISLPSPQAFSAFAAALNGGKIKRSAGFTGAGAGTATSGIQGIAANGGILQLGGITLPGNVGPSISNGGILC